MLTQHLPGVKVGLADFGWSAFPSLLLGRPQNASLPQEHGLGLIKRMSPEHPSENQGWQADENKDLYFRSTPYDSDLTDLTWNKASEI